MSELKSEVKTKVSLDFLVHSKFSLFLERFQKIKFEKLSEEFININKKGDT